MKSAFRRGVTLSVYALALCSITLQATAAAPRAWLVSKGEAQAVLVAESHFGTPIEGDSYFRTVVQPSYTAADSAIMETFWGPAQRGNEAADRGTPCFTDPKDRRTERLGAAFDQLIAATRANHIEVPVWMENWQVVPESLFTSLYLDGFMFNSLGHAYDTAMESQLGPGISFRLRASGQGPAAENIGGLESLKDRRAIFCGANATHREGYLADSVLKAAALLRLKQSDPSYRNLDKLAVPMGQALDAVVRCVDRATPCEVERLSTDERPLQKIGWMPLLSPGSFEIMVKQRTRVWIPLIESAIMAHRRTFIIVGSMHLPDLSIGGKVQPGLISLLRGRGFTVKSIAGPDDIKHNFLSPSWSDRMRSLLNRL
jgi:hypothetical protein